MILDLIWIAIVILVGFLIKTDIQTQRQLKRDEARILGRRKHEKQRCPLCGRSVAITAQGYTWYHRVHPGSRNARHHTVNMKTGMEV